jgi:hypothetical protein
MAQFGNSKHICLALINPKCQNNIPDVLMYHTLRLRVVIHDTRP